jgi:hypothetical protein
MAAKIISILSTTIFFPTGVWTLGIDKIWDVERETVPWVEEFGWANISFWYSTDQIKDFLFELGWEEVYRTKGFQKNENVI